MTTKKVALDKITGPNYYDRNTHDATKFNHDFYELVDLFMKETYPDYAWKFDIWLDNINKK